MGWFSRSKKVRFTGDAIVMAYADLERGKKWWLEAFECEQVPLPGWDNPLPSDIALKLPEDDEPVVLLMSRIEMERADRPGGDQRPMLFCADLDKARRLLVSRRVKADPIADDAGPRHFDIYDPEGQTIEICEDI